MNINLPRHTARSSQTGTQCLLFVNKYVRTTSKRCLSPLNTSCKATLGFSSKDQHSHSSAEPVDVAGHAVASQWERLLQKIVAAAQKFALAVAVLVLSFLGSHNAAVASSDVPRQEVVSAVMERVSSHSRAGTSYTGIDVGNIEGEVLSPAWVLKSHDYIKMSDPVTSMTTDYSTWPATQEEAIERDVQTAWRTDKLREMSYTQFLIHVREGNVERAVYTSSKKVLKVTMRPTAPGGARTERVALIYDPTLYDYMCAYGVFVEDPLPDPLQGITMGLIRLFTPLLMALMLIKVSFQLGQSAKPDQLFGGARMVMINSSSIPTTFNDIAGIDEVKEEILELITFLREQDRFIELGARSPAGVLLVGPPGTGKTLLAKAIAGEAGVPFFSSSGTDFTDVYSGVGASRVRDMFDRARKNAPCIVFIDEFDGIGQARSETGGGDEESVHTINQLLTEMDGFDDNTGVIVLAATNRPSSLDEALTRPGRFDRIVALPLPNLEGRVAVLKVHSRDKSLDADVNFQRVSRATAGFTGAELMNLMNTAAIETTRQARSLITEDDIFAALESIHNEKYGGGAGEQQRGDSLVTPLIRRSIATYMSAKAIIGMMSPEYDDIQKLVVTPNNTPTGYAYFIPQDAHLESGITTKSFMEAHIVVALAGRVAEQSIMGAANITSIGTADLHQANEIAREMIFRCGWSNTLGPISIMDSTSDSLNGTHQNKLAQMSPLMASKAMKEMESLMAAAEAKAYFGLVMNWELLNAMVELVMEKENHRLGREELEDLVASYDFVHFLDPYTTGFSFTESRKLSWPSKYDDLVKNRNFTSAGAPKAVSIVAEDEVNLNPHIHPLNPFKPEGKYTPFMAEKIMGEELYLTPEQYKSIPKPSEEEVRVPQTQSATGDDNGQ